MEISASEWRRYTRALSRLSDEAERLVKDYIAANGTEDLDALIRYAYQVSATLGEGAAALACQMYDEIAMASGAVVPAAMPAEVASYGEVAAAVTEVRKVSPVQLPSIAGRMVKRTAADTTLQNAQRDHAQFAWIPHGDTCPYCLSLAGLGWRNAGKKTLKGNHAEHIHNNCDCEYAIRFDESTEYKGYDPQVYNQILLDATGGKYDAEDIIRQAGRTSRWGGRDYEGINMVRREFYAESKGE